MLQSVLAALSVALVVATLTYAPAGTDRCLFALPHCCTLTSFTSLCRAVLPTTSAHRTSHDAPYITLACVFLLAVVVWSYKSVLSQRNGVRRHSAGYTIGLPEATVDVHDTLGKGIGAYAAQRIEVGSWVCRYVGKLVEWDEYVRLSQTDASLLDYMFKIVDPVTDDGEGAVFLDARESRHFSRYFNHAKEGNLEFEVYPEERRVEFFATRDIAAGEELTFDYGESYWTGEGLPVVGSDSRVRWTRGELDDGSGPFWHDEAGEVTLDDPYRLSASYATMDRLGCAIPWSRASRSSPT